MEWRRSRGTRTRILLFLCVFSFGAALAGGRGYVRITMYPYYHDEETAWRITVFEDGEVVYEESNEPIKEPHTTETVEWIEVSSRIRHQLPPKKAHRLLSRVRDLDLQTLGPKYSAQFSYTAHEPYETVSETGVRYVHTGETTHVVTHGETYRLQASFDSLTVDSSVYAPLAALEYEDPPHPHHDDVATIISAWFLILKSVGPVDEHFRAGTYRRWKR